MTDYIVALTSPSHALMFEPDNYFKVYRVTSPDLDSLSDYVDNYLMRMFALEFNVMLTNVRVLFAAKVKD